MFLKWWISMSAFYYVEQETDSDAFKLYQDIVATTVSLQKLLLRYAYFSVSCYVTICATI